MVICLCQGVIYLGLFIFINKYVCISAVWYLDQTIVCVMSENIIIIDNLKYNIYKPTNPLGFINVNNE